jgi:hypothetical protein
MDQSLYFALVAIYLVVLVGVTYALFFADPTASGISGVCGRFFIQTIPRYTRSLIKACFGPRVLNSFLSCINYIAKERNPLLIIAYLVIINGAFAGWLYSGVPLLPRLLASTVHIYGGYIGVIASQISFYLAVMQSPGRINENTVQRFNHQPFDGLLYTTGQFCKTCKVPKVNILYSESFVFFILLCTIYSVLYCTVLSNVLMYYYTRFSLNSWRDRSIVQCAVIVCQSSIIIVCGSINV